ncbi:MAG TPA: 16S rRNA (guanine(966)-N(2))-methyltransferase RsmD [Solimonas sp.]|nr:16S rRNA (guanine(966)-N(2))-methyltransferase RsmD [Solimonas sp.]
MPKRPPGKLRVIGGQWRSRLIEFDAADGVRPTPDRVRQTVFDWLAPIIPGARCLDLFAGSGALGIEALSRGAASCTFVETGARPSLSIKAALLALKAEHPDVVTMDAIYYVTQTWHRYHIVFCDPPFDTDLLARALPELPKILMPDSNRIYLEWPEGRAPALPAGFSLVREKQAGLVCFGLATYRHP